MSLFKQAPSRNHRGRGLRGKYAIKIFILLAICIWLLYQVKRSHDQKRAFEERNSHVLSSTVDDDSSPKTLNLGRKVLPRFGMQRNHEDETLDEEEETNVSKTDGSEHDDRDTGDDRSDGNGFGTVAEADRVDEQQIEDSKGNSDESALLEKRDQSTIQANSQEAREKHYNGDDASSAVIRDSQMVKNEGVGRGTYNFAKEQPENSGEKGFSFGDSSNGTSQLVGTDNLPHKSEPPSLYETFADHKEHTESIEKESTHEILKSNTSTEANTSLILPGESGDHLLLNGNMTNSTLISGEVRDMTTSEAVPPYGETAEANSTTPEVLHANMTESQDKATPTIHNEALSISSQNATLAFTSTSKPNSTAGETETNGKVGSSDGKDDHVESLTESQDNGKDHVKSLTKSQDNGALVVRDKVSIVPFQNATLTFNSTNKLNSTIGETETHGNLGSSDGKEDNVENITTKNADLTNTTGAAVMGLQENSTVSLASSSALSNDTSTSKESPNPSDQLPSQDAPAASPSIRQQKLSSNAPVTDEGRSLGLDTNGSSHAETPSAAEDSNLNEASKLREHETSSFTAAEHNLQGNTIQEPSISPSNVSAVSKDEKAQTHLPRMLDSRVTNSTSVDTAVG